MSRFKHEYIPDVSSTDGGDFLTSESEPEVTGDTSSTRNKLHATNKGVSGSNHPATQPYDIHPISHECLSALPDNFYSKYYNCTTQNDRDYSDYLEKYTDHCSSCVAPGCLFYHVDLLRNLSLRGFINSYHRRRIWPLLLGITRDDIDLDYARFINTQHYMYDQINKDVLRSCSHLDVHQDSPEEIVTNNRQYLCRMLQALFSKYTYYTAANSTKPANLGPETEFQSMGLPQSGDPVPISYCQGFHDIGVMCLVICGVAPPTSVILHSLAQLGQNSSDHLSPFPSTAPQLHSAGLQAPLAGTETDEVSVELYLRRQRRHAAENGGGGAASSSFVRSSLFRRAEQSAITKTMQNIRTNSNDALAFAILEKLSLTAMNENLNTSITHVMSLINTIPSVLQAFIPQFAHVLAQAPLVYSLSWFLTWFSHTTLAVNVIGRMFDFLLASNPVICVHLSSAVLLTHASFIKNYLHKTSQQRRWQAIEQADREQQQHNSINSAVNNTTNPANNNHFLTNDDENDEDFDDETLQQFNVIAIMNYFQQCEPVVNIHAVIHIAAALWALSSSHMKHIAADITCRISNPDNSLHFSQTTGNLLFDQTSLSQHQQRQFELKQYIQRTYSISPHTVSDQGTGLATQQQQQHDSRLPVDLSVLGLLRLPLILYKWLVRPRVVNIYSLRLALQHLLTASGLVLNNSSGDSQLFFDHELQPNLQLSSSSSSSSSSPSNNKEEQQQLPSIAPVMSSRNVRSGGDFSIAEAVDPRLNTVEAIDQLDITALCRDLYEVSLTSAFGSVCSPEHLAATNPSPDGSTTSPSSGKTESESKQTSFLYTQEIMGPNDVFDISPLLSRNSTLLTTHSFVYYTFRPNSVAPKHPYIQSDAAQATTTPPVEGNTNTATADDFSRHAGGPAHVAFSIWGANGLPLRHLGGCAITLPSLSSIDAPNTPSPIPIHSVHPQHIAAFVNLTYIAIPPRILKHSHTKQQEELIYNLFGAKLFLQRQRDVFQHDSDPQALSDASSVVAVQHPRASKKRRTATVELVPSDTPSSEDDADATLATRNKHTLSFGTTVSKPIILPSDSDIDGSDEYDMAKRRETKRFRKEKRQQLEANRVARLEARKKWIEYRLERNKQLQSATTRHQDRKQATDDGSNAASPDQSQSVPSHGNVSRAQMLLLDGQTRIIHFQTAKGHESQSFVSLPRFVPPAPTKVDSAAVSPNDIIVTDPLFDDSLLTSDERESNIAQEQAIEELWSQYQTEKDFFGPLNRNEIELLKEYAEVLQLNPISSSDTLNQPAGDDTAPRRAVFKNDVLLVGQSTAGESTVEPAADAQHQEERLYSQIPYSSGLKQYILDPERFESLLRASPPTIDNMPVALYLSVRQEQQQREEQYTQQLLHEQQQYAIWRLTQQQQDQNRLFDQELRRTQQNLMLAQVEQKQAELELSRLAPELDAVSSSIERENVPEHLQMGSDIYTRKQTLVLKRESIVAQKLEQQEQAEKQSRRMLYLQEQQSRLQQTFEEEVIRILENADVKQTQQQAQQQQQQQQHEHQLTVDAALSSHDAMQHTLLHPTQDITQDQASPDNHTTPLSSSPMEQQSEPQPPSSEHQSEQQSAAELQPEHTSSSQVSLTPIDKTLTSSAYVPSLPPFVDNTASLFDPNHISTIVQPFSSTRPDLSTLVIAQRLGLPPPNNSNRLATMKARIEYKRKRAQVKRHRKFLQYHNAINNNDGKVRPLDSLTPEEEKQLDELLFNVSHADDQHWTTAFLSNIGNTLQTLLTNPLDLFGDDDEETAKAFSTSARGFLGSYSPVDSDSSSDDEVAADDYMYDDPAIRRRVRCERKALLFEFEQFRLLQKQSHLLSIEDQQQHTKAILLNSQLLRLGYPIIQPSNPQQQELFYWTQISTSQNPADKQQQSLLRRLALAANRTERLALAADKMVEYLTVVLQTLHLDQIRPQPVLIDQPLRDPRTNELISYADQVARYNQQVLDSKIVLLSLLLELGWVLHPSDQSWLQEQLQRAQDAKEKQDQNQSSNAFSPDLVDKHDPLRPYMAAPQAIYNTVNHVINAANNVVSYIQGADIQQEIETTHPTPVASPNSSIPLFPEVRQYIIRQLSKQRREEQLNMFLSVPTKDANILRTIALLQEDSGATTMPVVDYDTLSDMQLRALISQRHFRIQVIDVYSNADMPRLPKYSLEWMEYQRQVQENLLLQQKEWILKGYSERKIDRLSKIMRRKLTYGTALDGLGSASNGAASGDFHFADIPVSGSNSLYNDDQSSRTLRREKRLNQRLFGGEAGLKANQRIFRQTGEFGDVHSDDSDHHLTPSSSTVARDDASSSDSDDTFSRLGSSLHDRTRIMSSNTILQGSDNASRLVAAGTAVEDDEPSQVIHAVNQYGRSIDLKLFSFRLTHERERQQLALRRLEFSSSSSPSTTETSSDDDADADADDTNGDSLQRRLRRGRPHRSVVDDVTKILKIQRKQDYKHKKYEKRLRLLRKQARNDLRLQHKMRKEEQKMNQLVSGSSIFNISTSEGSSSGGDFSDGRDRRNSGSSEDGNSDVDSANSDEWTSMDDDDNSLAEDREQSSLLRQLEDVKHNKLQYIQQLRRLQQNEQMKYKRRLQGGGSNGDTQLDLNDFDDTDPIKQRALTHQLHKIEFQQLLLLEKKYQRQRKQREFLLAKPLRPLDVTQSRRMEQDYVLSQQNRYNTWLRAIVTWCLVPLVGSGDNTAVSLPSASSSSELQHLQQQKQQQQQQQAQQQQQQHQTKIDELNYDTGHSILSDINPSLLNIAAYSDGIIQHSSEASLPIFIPTIFDYCAHIKRISHQHSCSCRHHSAMVQARNSIVRYARVMTAQLIISVTCVALPISVFYRVLEGIFPRLYGRHHWWKSLSITMLNDICTLCRLYPQNAPGGSSADQQQLANLARSATNPLHPRLALRYPLPVSLLWVPGISQLRLLHESGIFAHSVIPSEAPCVCETVAFQDYFVSPHEFLVHPASTLNLAATTDDDRNDKVPDITDLGQLPTVAFKLSLRDHLPDSPANIITGALSSLLPSATTSLVIVGAGVGVVATALACWWRK